MTSCEWKYAIVYYLLPLNESVRTLKTILQRADVKKVTSLINRKKLSPAGSRHNCKTHRQALQNFHDKGQESIHKNNKLTFFFLRSTENYVPVTVTFRFISEGTALTDLRCVAVETTYD
jgi:hypothetical protein